MASFGRYTPGQGFQSVKPGTPSTSGPIFGRSSGGGSSGEGGGGSSGGGSSGGGSRGGGRPAETSVVIRGNEVLINGLGFSVIPGQMSSFLASRGLSGSSYQSALLQAQKQDQLLKQQAEQKAVAQERARRIQEQRAVTQRLLKQAGIQQSQSALLNASRRDQSRENYLEQRQIGKINGVPVNRIFEVNPNTGRVKPLTREQENLLKNQPKELVAGTRNRVSEIINTYLPKKTPEIVRRGGIALGNIVKEQTKSLGRGYLKGQFLLDDLRNRGLTKYLKPDLRALSLSKAITRADNSIYQLLRQKYGQERANKFKEQTLSNKLRNDMYNNLIWKDPDLQNLGITTSLGSLGAGGKTSQAVAKWILRTMGTKQAYETYKNPTDENIIALGLYATPEIYRGIKNAKTRKDIMVADTGELVPLQNRLSQVDKIIKNQGRNIETITAKATKKAGFTNAPKNNIDYTYNKRIQFGTYKVGEIYPTSKYFLEGKSNKVQKLFKKGVVQISDVQVQSNAKSLLSQIRKDLLNNGRTSESNIRRLYNLAQQEADLTGKKIATISPKRLRGFWQAEQEIVKVIPKGYKPQRLNFGGWTETGHRIYTDKGAFRNVKDFLKSKLNVKNKELSYWAKVAEDKYQYLRGKLNIRGEYAQHGRKHLNPMDRYNKYYKYHDITKVGDVDSFAKFEHGQAAYDLWKSGKFPDKSIYRLPKNMQKKIAQAYAMHTEARFNIKSILKKRSSTDHSNNLIGNIKGYIQQKRNPYLQDVATLDRLDLTRFPSVVGKLDYKMLSKDALKRIFGSEENAVRQNLWKFDRNTIPKDLLNRAFKKNQKLNLALARQRKIVVQKQPRLKILDELKNPGQQIRNRLNKLYSGKLSRIGAIKLSNEISKKLGKKYTLNSLKRDTNQYFKKLNNYKKSYSKKINKYTAKRYNQKYISQYIVRGYPGKSYPGKPYPRGYNVPYQRPYVNGYAKPYPSGYVSPPQNPVPYKPSTPYKPVTPYKPNKPYTPVTPIKPEETNYPRLGTDNKKNKQVGIVKRKGYFDVFAKPSKSLSGRKTKKFIKVNQTPLDEQGAKDLRNYITDTSLSRSALITPSRNRPGRINIRFPRGYAAKTQGKFRDYRIVKGRKIPLARGRVIELSRNALDTIQEKNRIDLFKRIKQLQIKPRFLVKRKTQGINRPNLIKGSLAAKNYMAKLRKMR